MRRDMQTSRPAAPAPKRSPSLQLPHLNARLASNKRFCALQSDVVSGDLLTYLKVTHALPLNLFSVLLPISRTCQEGADAQDQ